MDAELPLSAAQQGVWYALKSGASPSAFNIGEYIRIPGPIEPALFETALRHVISETEAVQVRFVEHDDGPRQLIEPSAERSMIYRDVSSHADPVAVAEAWMRSDMARPVDLRDGPFFASALFKVSRELFLWYVRYHHLVMDGFGASLIARRVASVYSALAAGAAVEFKPFGSLAGLVEEDAAYRASGHFSSDRQYWLEVLADCPEPPSLGIAATPASGQFLRRTASLPAATVARLEHFAQRTKLSLPQVFTLCTAFFIHRLTEAEDVVLGQMLTARMTPTSRQIPAMVMNVVPLRLTLQHDMPVEDLVAQVRRNVRTGLRHQRYRIADIRRDLHRIDKPIIRQFVSVRPFEYDARFAGSCGTPCSISYGSVDDLNVQVAYDQSEPGSWRLEFDANPALYDAALLGRLQNRFLQLLAAMDDPAELIGRLDILPSDERRQVLVTWNSTRADYPRDRRVDELFEEQVQRTPDRVAVEYGQQRLTYRQLNEQADRLAHHLAAQGVRPNERVGLHVERSMEMVVGLLGILKAGGAYVPLDPNYPQDRLAFILDDSRPVVLLTQQSLRHRLQPGNADIICLDALPNQRPGTGCGRPEARRHSNDLAYVLYTSGSTGRPKGVQIPHRALVNFLKAMEHEPGITADDRLLAVTSLAFDIAGLELILPLIVGAQVTVAPSDVLTDGSSLAALLQECGATIMQATPATWRLLLEAGWEGSQSLKILCGGEAWTGDLAAALLPRCASLWNMYGPTETTVWSSVAKIEAKQPVVIGSPIANTTFYVLDRYEQPVPVGVPGELYIGGESVALGYLNRPALTCERFVPDPFGDVPAARMYKTGDRVRQLPDGRLEFLGRLDHQVKIRGYRIELGEIEAALRLHGGVRDAVVIARDEGRGDKRLIAYVTATGDEPLAVGSLRDLLRQKLPSYMMPAAFVPLDAFPLTPNGKLDRNALPSPSDELPRDTTEAYVAPRTPLEELLAGFWCNLLRLPRVSVHDSFFDLGGDSLAMLQLNLEIERVTGQSFPLTWMFDAPTVAGMAGLLGDRASASGYSPLVLLRPGTDASPVFIVHPIGGSTVRLMPLAKFLPGHHPIYGIQAKGFDGSDAPNDRVEAMAECYLSAITEVQPRGPYHLVGLCFGGLVAMEIARRLSERGETIGLLAFLDTFPHPRYWPLHFRLGYFVIGRIKETVSTLRAAKRHEVVPYIMTRLSALSRKLAAMASGKQSFLNAPESLPPAIKAVFEGGIAALVHYRPRYYPGKVSYLMCGYHDHLPDGPVTVWTGLIGQLDVQAVPADFAESVPSHPEYVAKWLFDRIPGAPDHDLGHHDAALKTESLETV